MGCLGPAFSSASAGAEKIVPSFVALGRPSTQLQAGFLIWKMGTVTIPSAYLEKLVRGSMRGDSRKPLRRQERVTWASGSILRGLAPGSPSFLIQGHVGHADETVQALPCLLPKATLLALGWLKTDKKQTSQNDLVSTLPKVVSTLRMPEPPRCQPPYSKGTTAE